MDKSEDLVCLPDAENAGYHAAKVLVDKTRKRKASRIPEEQLITVAAKPAIWTGLLLERKRLPKSSFPT